MKTCLIIDDVEVSRYAIKLFAEELGLACREANDAASARSSASSGHTDVIFLDWHLRKQSGLELIKELKNATNAPVVVVSGVEGLEKTSEAKAAGADLFLQKPTSREKVEQALKTLRLI